MADPVEPPSPQAAQPVMLTPAEVQELTARRAPLDYTLLLSKAEYDAVKAAWAVSSPPSTDPAELPPFQGLRRADGELVLGEYAWMAFDGDWVCAEEDSTPEAVWEVFEMRPVLIERRTYRYGQWADDPDRVMCEDCGQDHLGTGSVCDV